MSRRAETGNRLRTQLVGVAFLVILALLAWFAVAVYEKRFTPVDTVTLRTETIGSQMEEGAEVKARGVPFGEVREVRTTRDGAELDLAMDPGKIGTLPSNLSARLLPKTLFGQRYVQLRLPEDPSGQPLSAGDVIPQDRSRNAIELERLLGNLLPVLRAVQPEKLAASLGSISQALDGRGERLGESITELNDLLNEINPLMSTFQKDISGLADVSELYAKAGPDILRALADLTVTGQTIAAERKNLEALYANVTRAADDLHGFLRKNKDTLISLTASSKPTLRKLARYAPSFPCLFDAVNRITPRLERALGKGTGEPGLHVELSVQEPKGKYVPGRDTPVYDAGGGPKCYGPGSGPFRPADAQAGTTRIMALDDGLGVANSPYERRLISELMAPQLGLRPEQVPSWSSVLVGPVFRGKEVTLE